jgi:hypothetical protein
MGFINQQTSLGGTILYQPLYLVGSSWYQASVPDLPQVLKHVASLRELVARVLALPPDAQRLGRPGDFSLLMVTIWL